MKNCGDYRHKVVFQRMDTTQQDDGSYETAWTDALTTWAAIEPLSGREILQAGGMEGVYTHRIRTRALRGLTESMRIKFIDGFTGITRYFNIIAIRNVEFMNSEIQINCEERSYEQ